MNHFASLILLAGGTGTRMGGDPPKQFRLLGGKPVALHSGERFDALDEIGEIIVVCEPIYRPLFGSLTKPTRFALPGKRRQDSVYQGLLLASLPFVCVHDSARPFVEIANILEVLQEAKRIGAAALATPLTSTIKRVGSKKNILETLKREELWELQTPQVIQRELFLKAYEHAERCGIEATDDLSLVESLGAPCSIVPSSPRNLKLTTPLDWTIAQILCATN